ncbi:MAG: hypothetical protein ACOC7R_01480 [Planctomycetota bacterium]
MVRRATILAVALAGALSLVAPAAGGAAEPPDLPGGLDGPATRPSDDEPSLPSGLGGDDGGPALPEGLGGDEPGLPAGLDETAGATRDEARAARDKTVIEALNDAGFRGFLEGRGGLRTQNDPHQDDASLAEARFQAQWLGSTETLRMKVTGDILYDDLADDRDDIDLRRGRGGVDLREAWAGFSPLDWMDVKVGRQILTWGTGDLLFVNDLFPKDWQAFFLGRDVDYLKAPSDAVRISAFSDPINADLVYVPLMNPSRFISGRRLSYYNPTLGRLAGRDAIIDDDLPSEWFEDGEVATRLYRRVGSYELAAYGFWGFYKTPDGFDPAGNVAVYPGLNTYGASLRGPLGRGIGNVEAAYYDSEDDRDGTDPRTPNSQVRLLVGYEVDLPRIARDLTVGGQYYVEIMMDHDAYLDSRPAGAPAADEDRHVITVRLTKLLWNQTLEVSFFAYYSPTDDDAYLRPALAYDIDDYWSVHLAANVFLGEDVHTFFGQLQDNSNVYGALRYAF